MFLYNTTYECWYNFVYNSKYIYAYPVIAYLANVYSYFFLVYNYQLGIELAMILNKFDIAILNYQTSQQG